MTSASPEMSTEPGKSQNLIPPSAKGCKEWERGRLLWCQLPLPQVQAEEGACGEMFQAKITGLKLRSSCHGAELRAWH